jgi:hypothetical protein
MHTMTLNNLPHVHQLAQEMRRTRRRGTIHLIAGFCRCQMMADRANTADARRNGWHFLYQPPFAELLKPAKLINMQISALNLTLIIQVDSNFCMGIL